MVSNWFRPDQPEECCHLDTNPIVPTRLKRRKRGSALVELTLICPWFLFLFVGTVDMGFYTYSLITVENAARIAAEYTSQNSSQAADQATACTMVRAELAALPGVSGVADCSNATLTVTAASVAGPDTKPATSVSVSYRGLNMIPIPGLLMGRFSFTRNVQMRVQP
jgi:Flp pilus assembly protein TadG